MEPVHHYSFGRSFIQSFIWVFIHSIRQKETQLAVILRHELGSERAFSHPNGAAYHLEMSRKSHPNCLNSELLVQIILKRRREKPKPINPLQLSACKTHATTKATAAAAAAAATGTTTSYFSLINGRLTEPVKGYLTCFVLLVD